MAEPYAVTRLDALRKLRREGYAVVQRGCLHEFDPDCARCRTLARFTSAEPKHPPVSGEVS